MADISTRKASRHDLPAILRLYQEPGFDDAAVLDLDSAAPIFARMHQYNFIVPISSTP